MHTWKNLSGLMAKNKAQTQNSSKEDLSGPLLTDTVTSDSSEVFPKRNHKRVKQRTAFLSSDGSDSEDLSIFSHKKSISNASDSEQSTVSGNSVQKRLTKTSNSPRKQKQAPKVFEESSTDKDSPASSLKTTAAPRSSKKKKKVCITMPHRLKKHHLPESPLVKTNSVMPPPKNTKFAVLRLVKAKPPATNNSVGEWADSENEGIGEENEWTPQKLKLLIR